MVAIAAQYGCISLKTDTKQAFFNGEIGDEKIYIRPLDWWPQTVSQGHALLLMKSMYGTRQAAAGSPSMASENFWMDGIA
jgi:hypothetical protein